MPTPRPYQVTGAHFLAQRRFALLADEMRVGKTPQAILAARQVGAEQITVICPAIAREQWKREWSRWGGRGRLKVLSYEQAHKADPGLRDVLIVDEAHYCKNPEAARTKFIFAKGGLAYSARYVWALTGTPAPNHAGELWVMMRCFGIINMSYSSFLRAFCIVNWQTGKVVGTKPERIPELRGLLAQFMLRRTRKEVAPDMPGISYDIAPVKGDFDGIAIDERGYADEVLQLQNLLAAVPAADRAAWLERHASDFTEFRRLTAFAKVAPAVQRIDDMLRQGTINQTVVFGFYIDPLEMARDALQARGWRVGLINGKTSDRARNIAMEQFRLGLLDVMLGNIMAAGTAVDFSSASYGSFLELDWVVGNNVQAANRLVSMQTQQPVSMDVLTWAGSADDDVQATLARKAGSLKAIFA